MGRAILQFFNYITRRVIMPENKKEEPQHIGQKIFDNIWLLFVLSLLISTLLYNVWGIIDLMNVPFAK
jgi:hypothetical protein